MYCANDNLVLVHYLLILTMAFIWIRAHLDSDIDGENVDNIGLSTNVTFIILK
jgi:hypothetical protein